LKKLVEPVKRESKGLNKKRGDIFIIYSWDITLGSCFSNPGLMLVGLFAAGWGISRRSWFLVLLAPLGWVVFLVGLVQFLAPGFFGS